MENVLNLVRKYCEPKKVSSTKGGEYHSPCPGCGGTDRFHVWPEQNEGNGSWWCRQCGRGGDNIQFLREFEGLGYREACERLDISPRAVDTSYTPLKPQMQRTERKQTWKPDPASPPPSEVWLRKAATFSIWAFENLMNMDPDEGIKGWLARRGIDEFVIKHFGIGWNPGKGGKDLFRPRESWGLPTEFKEDLKKKLWIPMGLIIPMLSDDVPPKVHRIRFRREKDDPRYYVLPGSSMDCLVEALPGARAYVVVESELDAMMIFFAAKKARLPVGVVALGNASRKPEAKTARLLRDVPVILNALDYDKAGRNQNEWWAENFPRTIRWPVPVGKDPGEAFQKGINIGKWVKAGLPKGWFL
ncbi:zinc-binding domain of primase-helicase [delta proteobacterium NaphS2]|nr:zinc-binding domain of primase-helicase [delta proteobacterium NaphS2]